MRPPLLCRVKFWVLLVVLGLVYPNYIFSQTNAWLELGKGSNALNANGSINIICSDTSGNIYAAGNFRDSSGYYYVAKWNGNHWTELGLNNNALKANGSIVTLCTDRAGNIYAAGNFKDTAGYYCVAKWNGSYWIELGTDSGFLNATGAFTALCCDKTGNLYAAGADNWYVAKWNGNIWTQLGIASYAGVNPGYVVNSMCVDKAGNLFVAGSLGDSIEGAGNPTLEWDGLNWSEVSSGPPFYVDRLEIDGPGNAIVCDSFGVICVADDYNPGLQNHFVTSGTVTYGGGGPTDWGVNEPITTLCYDYNGHNYCAGMFYNSLLYRYVASYSYNYPGFCNEVGSGSNILHGNNYINSICVDQLGNLFAAGQFTNENGKPYVTEYKPLPHTNMFVYIKSTPEGCGHHDSIAAYVYNGVPPYHYVWSNGDTTLNTLALTSGYYFLTVYDSQGFITTGDIFVPDNCNTIVSGIVFLDTNNICNYNGQQGIPNVTLTLSGGNRSQYATTDYLGYYSFLVSDTGVYYINVQVGNSNCGNYTLCSNPAHTIYISNLSDTLMAVFGNNFAFIPDSSSFDLYLHPGWTSADPGFDKDYWIYFANNSPVPFTGAATVTFKYDPNLSFISSDIPVTNYNAASDSLTWVVNNFSNGGWNYIGKVHFNVPASLPLNYQLHSQFRIYPYTSDCDTANNYLQYYETVKGSHDPNYKEVSPNGYSTDIDSVLTYTIHYQNTGTDSTYFIVVKDTLSPYLNPATVRNLASSHSYSSFSISGAGVLTWTFVPLSLPAASADSTGSSAFIAFSVHRMANAPLGAVISNSASVYFDYDNAVLTNTATDTVVHTCTDTINQFDALCTGDSIYFYGRWIHVAGSYDTLVAGNPCDTLGILNLVVQDPLPPHYITDTICRNDSLFFAGSYLNTTGIYSHIGCDSSVILALVVLPVPVITITQTTCSNQPYYGHDTTGQYTDTFTTTSGCDSICILNLTVIPVTFMYDTVSICQGQTYIGHTVSGNYTDTLNGINGCDSIIILNLTVGPLLTTTIHDTICTGDSILFNGSYIDSAGIFTAHLTGNAGCDSVVSLILTVNALPVVTFTWDSLIKAGDVVWAGPLIAGEPQYDTIAFWCGAFGLQGEGPGLPDSFALKGGTPPGGVYSGRGVINNVFYIGSLQDHLDTIYYTYTNGAGCTATVLDSIAYDLCEGINEITSDNFISVFPNPNNTNTWQINVSAELANAQCQVFDVDGKMIYTTHLTGTNNTITTNLAAGTYIMRISTGQSIYNIKLVQF